MTFTDPQSVLDLISNLLQQARELQQQGKSEAALAIYRSILETDDRFLPALHQVAQICESQGEFSEAIEHYLKAIDIDENPPFWVYRHLGFALGQKGELEAAISAYQKAIALRPEDVATYNLLGQAHGKLGDFERAIAIRRRSISIPSSPVGCI